MWLILSDRKRVKISGQSMATAGYEVVACTIASRLHVPISADGSELQLGSHISAFGWLTGRISESDGISDLHIFPACCSTTQAIRPSPESHDPWTIVCANCLIEA